MNDQLAKQFVSHALRAGVPQEKIAALLNKADEISTRRTKTAATKFDIVDSLLTNAGLQKTASSVAYTQGLLSEALTNGANVPQAYGFAKQALEATNTKLAFMQKVAAISNSPALSKYAEGFLGSAKQAGIADDEALSLLVNVIDNQKQASGDPMFKSPAPDGAPAAGAPPGGGAGGPPPGAGAPPPGGAPGGEPPHHGGHPGGPEGQVGQEEQQLMELLQSLPPEQQQQIVEQLLAAIQGGGQGGPGGPGGPGGQPPGAGAPPPGGGGMPPQGPA